VYGWNDADRIDLPFTNTSRQPYKGNSRRDYFLTLLSDSNNQPHQLTELIFDNRGMRTFSDLPIPTFQSAVGSGGIFLDRKPSFLWLTQHWL
jgi:hypothetical protein